MRTGEIDIHQKSSFEFILSRGSKKKVVSNPSQPVFHGSHFSYHIKQSLYIKTEPSSSWRHQP
jgi:hypothetical protein